MIANMLMRLGKILGRTIAALVLFITPAIAAETTVTFTGEVTYRERIALPDNAELRVTLVSLSDGEPVVGASATLAAPGQVPLQFALDVRSEVLEDDGEYGLHAEILSGGAVLFHNPVPVPVDVPAPLPVLIIVNFAPRDAAPAEPPPGELDVSATLFDTIWQVRDIGGADIIQTTLPTLSIAPDRRAGGNGSCNNYFTEANFDGPALSFGPVAGTRMACAPEVMAQEAAFFAALSKTAGYRIDAQRLYLLDSDGDQLVRLIRGQ
jgi:putative lipoprotein